MACTMASDNMISWICTLKPRASSSFNFSAVGVVWSLSIPVARKA